jgi:hypothetical protein
MQIRLRLQDEVHQGFYYEAQQTYKATYYRYAAKGSFEDAFALLRVRLPVAHPRLSCPVCKFVEMPNSIARD